MNTTTYLRHAENIGLQLYREAIWHKDNCNWTSIEYDPADGGRSNHFQPMQGDFYKGLPGVALFFASLFRETGEKRFRKTAIGACRQALLLREQIPAAYRFSFFRGWPGQILTAELVARYCEDEQLSAEAVAAVQALLKEEVSNSRIDVIDGLAGGLPALIVLDSFYPQLNLRSYIEQWGRHLLDRAITTSDGLYWITHPYEKVAMPGFSHGASGIAWALFEVYEFTQNSKYLEAATAALSYEKKHLIPSPQASASGQLRQKDWAHGSAGLAMTQWKAYHVTRKEQYLSEALRLTEESCKAYQATPWLDISPCNGIWGLIDALLLGDSCMQKSDFASKAEIVASGAVNHWSKMGEIWADGFVSKKEVPDFMISLSGAGYGFLRLVAPQRYPSVLAIERSKWAEATAFDQSTAL